MPKVLTSSRLKNNRARRPHKKKKWSWSKIILLILLVFLLVGIIFFCWKVLPLLRNLPSPDDLTAGNERFSVATQIYDRNGQQLYELYDDERRLPVSLHDLPAYVGQASIAIEDKNFYRHFGFDPIGITRAFIVNKLRGDLAQGGSTITQQLMKKAFLSSEKSYDRKVKEIALAIITEMRYNKDQILEMYLNYIPYGGTAVGIGSAADTYFGKRAADLTLAEAALLAGLPQAPSKYSPFASDATAAKERQAEVLKNMVEMEFITQEEADAALAEELVFAKKQINISAPHFVFYVRDQLYEMFGEEKVLRGGLRVTTTLDLVLQEDAQATLSAEIDDLDKLKVGNGAALITKPNTGEILAMVGSRNYYDEEHDGQVNVTLAKRQPGSSIKPLVYATAFEQKLMNPSSILLDVPTCFENIGQPRYCPKNYSGGFNGPVTVRQALGSSLNIPAVKVLRIIGLESFIDQAQKMGISTWEEAKNYGWSLSLGGGEVKMIDMAQSFAVLANQGIKVPLISITKVEDYQGNVLYEADIEERKQLLALLQANPEIEFETDGNNVDLERVLQPESSYLISHIMRDDRARWLGFGSNSELVIKGKEVAVKTGTTNDVRDNWTIGFTPNYLAVVWVGNTDGSAMNYRLVSGVTGAAPIWNDLMSRLLTNEEIIWPAAPETIQEGNVCWTGMPLRSADQKFDENGNEIPMANGCGDTKRDLYWTKSYPTRSGVRTEPTWINPITGLPPKEDESQEGLEPQDRQIAQDPLLDYYCLDCVRAVDENGRQIVDSPYYVSEGMGARQYGD